MRELLKAGAQYVHKETEAATLQQQLEVAKSVYLFMLPYALNYSDCRTELLNHRLALLWAVLRSHEALMTRKLWTFFIKSFPKLLAS